MGYQMTRGNRWAATVDFTMTAASVVTTTGAIAASVTELGDAGTCRLDLVATAVGGTTPSITLTVETSKDGSTNWVAVGAFTAVTANGSQRKAFGPLDRFIRLNATTVTGTTPTGTFAVTGEATS